MIDQAAVRIESLTATGREARRRGDLPEALVRLETALRLAELEGMTAEAEAIADLVRTLLQADRLVEAEYWVRRGTILHPFDAVFLTLLGEILRRGGHGEEAFAVLERAERLAPEDAGPKLQLALLELDRDEPAEAARLFDRVIALAPEVAEHHRLAATALRRIGDLEGAGTALETALALAPREAATWVDLAILREEAGRPEDTLPILEAGMASVGLHRRLVAARLSALRRRRRDDRHAERCHRSLEVDAVGHVSSLCARGQVRGSPLVCRVAVYSEPGLGLAGGVQSSGPR